MHQTPIALPASLNFRALDGLKTRTGMRIASGKLHRSGAIAQLALWQAEALARSIGLRTVVDLRTTLELAEFPSTSTSWRLVHLPLFETALVHWLNPEDQSPDATAARYFEMLEIGADAIVRLIDILSRPDALPAVIHCAAGRDRTGIVVACLLDVLGVLDDVIATDYALSDAVIDDGGRALHQTPVKLLAAVRAAHGSTRSLLLSRGASIEAIDAFSRALLVVEGVSPDTQEINQN